MLVDLEKEGIHPNLLGLQRKSDDKFTAWLPRLEIFNSPICDSLCKCPTEHTYNYYFGCTYIISASLIRLYLLCKHISFILVISNKRWK